MLDCDRLALESRPRSIGWLRSGCCLPSDSESPICGPSNKDKDKRIPSIPLDLLDPVRPMNVDESMRLTRLHTHWTVLDGP